MSQECVSEQAGTHLFVTLISGPDPTPGVQFEDEVKVEIGQV